MSRIILLSSCLHSLWSKCKLDLRNSFLSLVKYAHVYILHHVHVHTYKNVEILGFLTVWFLSQLQTWIRVIMTYHLITQFLFCTKRIILSLYCFFKVIFNSLNSCSIAWLHDLKCLKWSFTSFNISMYVHIQNFSNSCFASSKIRLNQTIFMNFSIFNCTLSHLCDIYQFFKWHPILLKNHQP